MEHLTFKEGFTKFLSNPTKPLTIHFNSTHTTGVLVDITGKINKILKGKIYWSYPPKPYYIPIHYKPSPNSTWALHYIKTNTIQITVYCNTNKPKEILIEFIPISLLHTT